MNKSAKEKGCEFFLAGGAKEGKRFHYTQCGLDDVFLLNGFREKIVDGEKAVSITNMDGLHRTIGLHLVLTRKTLKPKELRFLRRQMDLTQSELGERLRLSSQQVARWEKGESEITGSADKLLRMVFLLSLPEDEQHAVQKLIRHLDVLEKQDQTRTVPPVFKELNEEWKQAA